LAQAIRSSSTPAPSRSSSAGRLGRGALGLIPRRGIGEALTQRAGQRLDVLAHRVFRHAGFDAPEQHQPAVALVLARGGVEVERAPEPVLGGREVEAARHHADDGGGLAVQHDALADDGLVSPQLLLPHAVAQHRHGLGAGPILPGAEGAPHEGTGADHVEQLGGGHAHQHDRARGIGPQRGAVGGIGSQRCEGADALAEIIELHAAPVEGSPEHPNAVLVGDRQGSNQDRADHAGEADGSAEAQGEGEDAERGEAGLAPELAEGVAQVRGEVLEQVDAPAVAGALPLGHLAAETAAGLPLGLGRSEALGDELLGFHLEMEGEFVLELALHGPGPDDGAEAEEQISKQAHRWLLRSQCDETADPFGAPGPPIVPG
jgi:hypothetical protein